MADYHCKFQFGDVVTSRRTAELVATGAREDLQPGEVEKIIFERGVEPVVVFGNNWTLKASEIIHLDEAEAYQVKFLADRIKAITGSVCITGNTLLRGHSKELRRQAQQSLTAQGGGE